MKLGLQLNVGLQQTLTPQQIQYLKLLQLPALQMEQHIRQEIEQNPMIEEMSEDGSASSPDISASAPESTFEASEMTGDTLQHTKQSAAPLEFEYEEVSAAEEAKSGGLKHSETYSNEPETTSFDSNSGEPDLSYDQDIPEDSDAFEFYKLLWQDDSVARRNTESSPNDDDDDYEPFQIKDTKTFEDELLEQLHYLDLSEEEVLLGEQIIGNLEDDGYLRRNLKDILDDTNNIIEETNHERRMAALASQPNTSKKSTAKAKPVDTVSYDTNGYSAYNDATPVILTRLNLQKAEGVLEQIQELDPPGCASRTVQECLVAQLRALPRMNAAQKLAYEVLTKTYEPFTMKHYQTIARQLEVTEDYLREALDVIRRLNPKPGYGSSTTGINSIIPDFIVERTEDSTDVLISVNDSTLPALRLSSAYEKLKREARFRKFNKDTRDWLRKKHEDAKFLMSAIRQRKATMLKVMTTIASLQRGFFDEGPAGLRPLIYKDVAEESGMDISTVCRVVNNKYVQTEFGIFELRFFFSESLTNDEGDEVSTTIIKDRIKEIIGKESKEKPWSDDKLAKELKKAGFNVARRTVAKYREQLKIPVARLRREL
ncbi:MAG: RNA polymerase factor sigma-54 [Bacteriodetes bacterium]|nr:RNA polymerase factor sigma-54 [Bacteroidota bacterium]